MAKYSKGAGKNVERQKKMKIKANSTNPDRKTEAKSGKQPSEKSIRKKFHLKGKDSPKGPKQYPPIVGYHGTDDEKELNPEE